MTKLLLIAALTLSVAACTSSGSGTGGPSYRSYGSDSDY